MFLVLFAEVTKIYTDQVAAMEALTVFVLHVLFVMLVSTDQVVVMVVPMGQLTASAHHVHVLLEPTKQAVARQQPTASAPHALPVQLAITDQRGAMRQPTVSAHRVLYAKVDFILCCVQGLVLVYALHVQIEN